MPIGTFISQPDANSLMAAYRPVVLRVYATRTDDTPIPPVVYCDVYFNDVFYKTLSKTQYTALNDDNSEWEFDIQDAAQEYLQKFLAAYGHAAVTEATPIITKASCKFRSTGFNSEGFITSEETAPVQGTGDTDPVSGNGTVSNAFYILNATLQHEDNQDIATHLHYYKTRTWSVDALPASHRPDNYVLNPDDTDSFPIIYKGANTFKKLILNYKLCGQSTFAQVAVNISAAPACNAIISQPIVTAGVGGWTVSWALVSGSPVKYFVSTPAVSAGAPHETLSTNYFYTTAQLPVGTHTITVRPLCQIEGVYYPGAPKTIDIVVTPCIAVGFGSLILPDANVGIAYDHEITLTGTAPFVLNPIGQVKPSWMTITLTGSTVTLTGTPAEGDVGENIQVSFEVTNCTADTATFDSTMNVTAPVAANFILQNGIPDEANVVLNSFSPSVALINSGSLPVNGEETAWGMHSGFSDALTVEISNPDNAAGCVVRLFKNGSMQQCINIGNGTQEYEFDAVTFSTVDECTIALYDDGPCA